jgi:hypothetical protein
VIRSAYPVFGVIPLETNIFNRLFRRLIIPGTS